MRHKEMLLKLVVSLFLVLFLSASIMVGYAYWDSNDTDLSNTIGIGNWGTAISTPQDFYDMATNQNSLETDRYFLMNDIDFTGFNYTFTSTDDDAIFRGTLNGNGKTLSNLTVFSNDGSQRYLGIFPQLEGATIINLSFVNVETDFGANIFSSNLLMAGLITGNVRGGTNIIEDITITNSGVRGTDNAGVGGLIGRIILDTAVVQISNVLADGLKVFNTDTNVGGIIGLIRDAGATLELSDIDFKGQVFSADNRSHAGGLIGKINPGGIVTIARAIVEASFINTLETDPQYLNQYSKRYLGGLIGQNRTDSTSLTITDAFFTGSLFNGLTNRRADVGTVIGRDSGSETLTRVYYSMVEFRDASGNPTYNPGSLNGVMSTLVNATSMPTISQWNSFATEFYNANSLWAQDFQTGRLYLIR